MKYAQLYVDSRTVIKILDFFNGIVLNIWTFHQNVIFKLNSKFTPRYNTRDHAEEELSFTTMQCH